MIISFKYPIEDYTELSIDPQTLVGQPVSFKMDGLTSTAVIDSIEVSEGFVMLGLDVDDDFVLSRINSGPMYFSVRMDDD